MDQTGDRSGENQRCKAACVILDAGFGPDVLAGTGQRWRFVCDQVMGGVSTGSLQREKVAGEMALHLRGDVRLENNGGFVQMALPLAPFGQVFDASRYRGLRLRVRGNSAHYNLHLRSADMTAVWQSWRASFTAAEDWRDIVLLFTAFRPHRTDLPVDPARLTRLGLVAIGQQMQADLALARLDLV